MRTHDDSNRRKAIDMLFNIPRQDVSLALCESFRKTVDAMTTAIEPNASPQAKGHMRSAMTEFQALVEKERVVGSGGGGGGGRGGSGSSGDAGASGDGGDGAGVDGEEDVGDRRLREATPFDVRGASVRNAEAAASVDPQLPKGATYIEGWVTDPTSVTTTLSEVEYKEYPFRGRAMKRAPKREFYYPGHGDKVYKWGQETSAYPGGDQYSGEEMPEWMKAIADRIRSEFGGEVNHAIAIKYARGTEHHAPPHKDKVDDDTSFFVLSFGTPRTFQLLSQSKPTEVVEWEAALASGSLLVISGALNKSHFHAVPKDEHWTGDPRYSLIFRTIR